MIDRLVRKKLIEYLLTDKDRPVGVESLLWNGEQELEVLTFEYKVPSGKEFCVDYVRKNHHVPLFNRRSWKIDHINKWVDPVLGDAEDNNNGEPWRVDISNPQHEAVLELLPFGLTVDDIFNYKFTRFKRRNILPMLQERLTGKPRRLGLK